jgi:hypothetical protein
MGSLPEANHDEKSCSAGGSGDGERERSRKVEGSFDTIPEAGRNPQEVSAVPKAPCADFELSGSSGSQSGSNERPELPGQLEGSACSIALALVSLFC